MKETTLLETYFMMGKCGDNSLLSGALHLLTDIHLFPCGFLTNKVRKKKKKEKEKRKNWGL